MALFEGDCRHCGRLVQYHLPGEEGEQNRHGLHISCDRCESSVWARPEGKKSRTVHPGDGCPWFTDRVKQPEPVDEGGADCPWVSTRRLATDGGHAQDGAQTPHRVYLAGPMNHVRDHGRGWREHLIENESEGIEYLNPLDLNDEHDFDPDEPVPTWVVDADLEMVEAADTVLAWLPFETPSRGTAVEIWEAGKDPDTSVIVWTDAPQRRFSPFVRGPADAFAGSMEGALSRLQEVAKWGEARV